jgi:hypothetical protein
VCGGGIAKVLVEPIEIDAPNVRAKEPSGAHVAVAGKTAVRLECFRSGRRVTQSRSADVAVSVVRQSRAASEP